MDKIIIGVFPYFVKRLLTTPLPPPLRENKKVIGIFWAVSDDYFRLEKSRNAPRIRASKGGGGYKLEKNHPPLFNKGGLELLVGFSMVARQIMGKYQIRDQLFCLFKNFCKDAKVLCIYLLFISILIHQSLKIKLLKKKICSFFNC